MAKSVNTSAIRANRVNVLIDTDLEYLEAVVSVKPGYNIKDVMSQRYGQVPVVSINNGGTIEGYIDLLETDDVALKKFGEITLNLPMAIGAQVTTHTMRIHDPADGATTTNDLYLPKVRFGGIEAIENQGTGERIFRVPFVGLYDSSAGGAWKLYGS